MVRGLLLVGMVLKRVPVKFEVTVLQYPRAMRGLRMVTLIRSTVLHCTYLGGNPENPVPATRVGYRSVTDLYYSSIHVNRPLLFPSQT